MQSGLTGIVSHFLSLPNIDVNQSMTNGASPLIIGCYVGNASCVKQLLSHSNIDTSLVFQEQAAFHWCQADSRADGWEFLDSKINTEGRVQIIQLLTEAGANNGATNASAENTVAEKQHSCILS
jgi:ankyrin repeat protein